MPTTAQVVRRGFWISVYLAIGAAACSQPTSPTPDIPIPPAAAPNGPQPVTVSGTVFVRGTDGVRPLTGGTLFGWVESGNSGRSIGAIKVDVSGGYTVNVTAGERLHVHTGDVIDQPCAASRTVTAGATRDVTLIADRSLLGARIPADVVAGTRMLSGTVYEIDSDGNHRPIEGVAITFDGLDGLWVPFATTQTDADGRYVLCGLDDEVSAFLWALKGGYLWATASIALFGSTTLDIEMTRR